MALVGSASFLGRAARPSLLAGKATSLSVQVRQNSDSGPEYKKLWNERLKEVPAVKRFRKWYGLDDPLYDLQNYPVLPKISQTELPTHGWWDNYERRNKNTVLHAEHDALTIWLPDVYAGDKAFHIWKAWMPFVIVAFSLLSWYVCLRTFYYVHRWNPDLFRSKKVSKQYPHGNLYVERGGDKRYTDGYFPSGPRLVYHPYDRS